MEKEPKELDENFVKAVGGNIRQRYMAEKSKILGKPVKKIGRRHDKPETWRKAGEQCLRLKADPESYVRACFKHCGMTTGPFANMLGGAAAKKWWQQFLSSLRTEVKVATESGEGLTEALDRVGLSHQIKTARQAMMRINGTYKPTKENLNWVCAYSSKMEPHTRVLLAYPDIRVKERCGAEAYEVFITNPNVIEAAKKLGYPIDDILEWLKEQ